MTESEIIRHIDEGAQFYIHLLGSAEHMEIVEREFYSYIKPKSHVHGISFVYNIRIEGLDSVKQRALVSEIKALNMPIWLDLNASDALFLLFFGRDKSHGQTVFHEDDEVYMALLSNEQPDYPKTDLEIVRVSDIDDFKIWAQISNETFASGLPDVHPNFHYPLCRNGLMKCYILYENHIPTAICAIIDHEGIDSLEFVATIPRMRQRGYAKTICQKAVADAFAGGAKIVTVRANNSIAAKLYQSMGFKAYNYAL